MSSVPAPSFTVSPPGAFDVPNSDLHVRPFRESDADKLLELAQEPAVQQYVPWAKRVHDIASAKDVLQAFIDMWNHKTKARYAIEQAGTFVGYCGLWRDKQPDYYEFGFAMLPAFRGNGIGTKVISELMQHAKKEMKAKGIVAYVRDTNMASKSVVTKLGLQPTEEFDAGDRRYELHFR